MYLFSKEPCTFISDKNSLKDAFKKKDLQGLLARLLDFLSEYKLTIQYNAGKDTIPPDFLSLHGNDPATDEAFDKKDIKLFCRNIGGDDPVADEGQF